MSEYRPHPLLITQRLIRQWRSRGAKLKIADTLGTELSGQDALMRTLILQRLFERNVLGKDEQYVGLLLPPSVGGVLANVALAFSGRVSVNLNYTTSSAGLNECIRQAGIKHVITSRKFMEKMNFQLDAPLVYLDDFKDKVQTSDKAWGFLASRFLPIGLLDSLLGLGKHKPDDPLTVIFTSGSTGVPKGVVLTYGNINHNADGIDSAIHLSEDDVVIGVLPLFHSFGYTVTFWSAMSLAPSCIYHFNPLDARQIGKLTEKYKGTVLLATPTFLRTYIRRVEPEQFKTLSVVVAGAEKLPASLSDEFEQRFGIRPVEGYGTTELSPLVSVNIPPCRDSDKKNSGRREGSVGRPVPGTYARIVSLDDHKTVMPTGETGMLQISGANVMKGYLHREDLTSKVLRDGWYETGDVAFLDKDGFIHITGRQSRFSKIGGEMVPHLQIEEAIAQLIAGPTPSEDGSGPQAVVTAVPDAKRGERIIVLHTKLPTTPSAIVRGLSDAGLPNLFLPSEDSFLEIESIPVLGTGKLDLRAVQDLAKKHFTAS